MKKKIFGLGLLAASLILAITLTGCPNGNNDNNNDDTDDALSSLTITGAPVEAMEIQTSVDLVLVRYPSGALVPGGIIWETSPENAEGWISLTNRTISGVRVTAIAGTADVDEIPGYNDEGKVAIRAVFGTGSDRVESAWVQIEVEGPPALASLSIERFGTTLTRMIDSQQPLSLVVTPAIADPGTITWYPRQNNNPNVWVEPAADGLSAVLHTGPNATSGPVVVTATSDAPGSEVATLQVSVIATPTLVLWNQGSPPANVTATWPMANTDGRFVIANERTTGGIASHGVTHGTWVTLYPPLDPADGDITFSARVRIAAHHDATRGNTRGLFMGFFNDPTGMVPQFGEAPQGQAQAVRDSAVSASRHGTDGSVAMLVTRASDNTVSAAQHSPALSGGFDTEYIVTATRRPDMSTTFVIKDALGNVLRTGERDSTTAQSMNIDPIHIGFAVFVSTVELSQIRISQGGHYYVEMGDTTPTVPDPDAVSVTGPTTVIVGTTSPAFSATVGPGGAPQDVVWSVGLNADGTAGDIAAFATWNGTARTLTGVAPGTVYVTATAYGFPNVRDTQQVEVVPPAAVIWNTAPTANLTFADGTDWAAAAAAMDPPVERPAGNANHTNLVTVTTGGITFNVGGADAGGNWHWRVPADGDWINAGGARNNFIRIHGNQLSPPFAIEVVFAGTGGGAAGGFPFLGTVSPITVDDRIRGMGMVVTDGTAQQTDRWEFTGNEEFLNITIGTDPAMRIFAIRVIEGTFDD